MNKKCRLKLWLRMGGAAFLLGLPLVFPIYEIQPAKTQWSALGHAKRYLRINEYLFNGTQKVTAIAWQTGADAGDITPA